MRPLVTSRRGGRGHSWPLTHVTTLSVQRELSEACELNLEPGLIKREMIYIMKGNNIVFPFYSWKQRGESHSEPETSVLSRSNVMRDFTSSPGHGDLPSPSLASPM